MTELDHKLRADYDKIGKSAKYGTAGFRDLATNMPYISFRVGVFVTVLNKTQPSKSLGVVMSASHNKIEDNGLKITNFMGNMLEMSYESVLEKFVDQADLQKAVIEFKKYLANEGKTVFECPVNVFIGGDTRPSTPELLSLVAKGIEYADGMVINFNLTTTPQLQYYVYLYNTQIKPKNLEKETIDPEQIRSLYWKNFSAYYRKCMQYLQCTDVKKRCLDCANGIGGKIIPFFEEQLKDLIALDLINNSNPELLNKNCGADFIKVDKTFPSEYEPKQHNCFVSFDGDADRIVEFVEQEKKLALIDGDRQGTIFTTFYKRISQELKERTQKLNESSKITMSAPCNPTIGFVQTFYANYSSSEYLYQNYKMDPIYAATGVKFLHEKAEHFDIGVYFEANGHGTVIFNESFLGKIDALLSNKEILLNAQFVKTNQELKKSIEEYFKFVQFYFNACKLANPSVGDAICNFLIFQLALTYLKLNYEDTLNLYTDLKSKTSKIAVKSKENVKTTSIEDKVTSPQGLQETIDGIVRKHDGRKAFLRPSGTENVLRLHVQAKTMEQVQLITSEINALVSKHPELN